MSNKFDELSKVRKRRFDWKIKVRLIRLWRGATKTGEQFKGFNMILLDNKVLSMNKAIYFLVQSLHNSSSIYYHSKISYFVY